LGGEQVISLASGGKDKTLGLLLGVIYGCASMMKVINFGGLKFGF